MHVISGIKGNKMIFKGTGFQLTRVGNENKHKINYLESEIKRGFIFMRQGEIPLKNIGLNAQ